MKAEICPVCGGNGIVDEGFYRQTSGQWTSTGGTETCRSCGGKGWVGVEETVLDAGPYWGNSTIGEYND